MPAEEPGEPQALRAGQQFTPEERKAVSIAKKKSLETARKYPEARRLEIQTDRNGNPKFEQVLDAEGNAVLDAKGRPIMEVAFAKLPYDLLGSPKLSKNRDRAVMQTADLLEGDARKAFNDPAISKGIGWYSRMRDFLQQQFGASIEVFGQLLGATSARTPVDTNFRQALEALKLLSTGQYDGLLADFSQYANKVYSDAKSGELLRQWQEKNPGKKPSAFKVEDEIRKQINKFEGVPLRANGKKYNANSQKVLHVLYGLWLDQTVGPKTPNFAGNLTGRTLKATIDVWAARNLRRLLYEGAREKWRLLPEQETGVTDPDFFFAQDAYDVVAKRLGMNADDLQALMWFMEKDVWEKNGWTSTVGAEKSSFDKEAGKLALDRFQAGVTTFTDLSKFKSDIQEKERLALRKSISGLEGLVAARVNNSSGLYGGVFEPSFDIEFSVSKNPDGTTKNISNQISEIIRVASQPGRVQSDVFVSQIVPPTHPNARPIMEVGFKKGASWDDISEAVAAFQDNGIDGFTLARDDRGNVIGIRAQYIPEFSAVYDSLDHLDPQMVASKMQDWVSRANAASVALDRIDNVSYKKTGTVSTIVYGLEEYSTARPIEPGSTSRAAELGRRRAIAEQRRQVPSGADAGQAVEPGAGGLQAPAGDVQPAGVQPQAEVGAQRFMPDYSGEHRAPRRDSGAPLDNLKDVYPDDVYGPNAARYYGHESGSQTDKAAVRIIQATKGKPDAPVKVFRAIPKSIESNEINPGDWITTIKSYAVQHGEGPLGGDYKILEKTVPAGDLYTDGNSIFEFGYDPKFMPQPDSSMPGAYTFTGGYRAIPGKTKGSLRLYGPAGSLIGIAASLDEAQRIIRRKATK